MFYILAQCDHLGFSGLQTSYRRPHVSCMRNLTF